MPQLLLELLPKLLLQLLPKLLLQLLPKLLLELVLPELLQLSGQLLRADHVLCTADLLRTGHHMQLHAGDRVRARYQLRANDNVQLQLCTHLQLHDVFDAVLPADMQLSVMQLLVVLLAFVLQGLLSLMQLQVP